MWCFATMAGLLVKEITKAMAENGDTIHSNINGEAGGRCCLGLWRRKRGERGQPTVGSVVMLCTFLETATSCSQLFQPSAITKLEGEAD
jgi:hypothetical protein